MTSIEAFVTSGRGQATVARADEIAALSRARSTLLVNGSLNLLCRSPVWLDTETAVFVNNHGSSFYWEAWLNDFPVFANRWVGGCPAHIFEIYAGELLRAKYGLRDGDSATLTFRTDSISAELTSSRKNLLAWYLAWWGRESRAYEDDRYLALMGRFSAITWRSSQQVSSRR